MPYSYQAVVDKCKCYPLEPEPMYLLALSVIRGKNVY